ncbi:MAG: thiolase family protein [Deltaproteobacteria bacterium]|nr:thiolase family protein [Deltaproteobacteria bacterium]
MSDYANASIFKEGPEVWVVDGLRSPFAKSGTVLKDMKAVALGVHVLRDLLYKLSLAPKEVDEIVIGNTGNPEDAANISRIVALEAGIPKERSAYTVHRNCASAMEAVSQGFIKIKTGLADVVVAGGTESMSNLPLLFSKPMTELFTKLMTAKTVPQKLGVLSSFRPQFLKPIIAIQEGLTDAVCGLNMGETAELLAKENNISREEQDRFALKSHERAVVATESGRFKAEISPIPLPPKYDTFLSEDVGPRKGQSMEALAKLKPYFDRRNGTVTVGNACPITDGSCMLVLMNAEKAKALGYKPLGRIRSFAFAGVEPERMGLGPAYSSPVALDAAGLTLKDMGVVEINEAFAAQVIAVLKMLASKKFAQEKLGRSDAIGEIADNVLNPNGGAIALGHPVGATGARLVLTALKEMQLKNIQFGLATLCIGGGQGGSVVVERV